MTIPSPSRGESPPQVPQALLLSGDGLRTMDGERLQMLRELVGGIGLNVNVIDSIDGIRAINDEALQQPVPAGRSNFLDHAAETSFTDRIAALAWCSVQYTGARYEEGDALPRLRFLDAHKAVVDLRSVKSRLVGSAFSHTAWVKGSKSRVGFLRSIIGAYLDTDND